VTGTTASELTGGVGIYLREHCGMTVGWVRGGGSHVFVPETWPKVGTPVSRARSVPWSHVTQVCTHSYTLVWHGWEEWERFIDWMALVRTETLPYALHAAAAACTELSNFGNDASPARR